MIHDDDAAPFYNELAHILNGVNDLRNPQDQISYRRAIVDGLGLRDSFSAKIRSGQYKATLERLISLSNLLGVPPITSDAYVRRWGHEQVDNNHALLSILRTLAGQPENVQELLLVVMTNYLNSLLSFPKSGPALVKQGQSGPGTL